MIFSKRICPHCKASVSELHILFRVILSGIAIIEFSTIFTFFILESLLQSILLFAGLLIIIGLLEFMRINAPKWSRSDEKQIGE